VNEYVLALYDVRSKQKFIYRSNKIKEIVGGSKLIEDVFTNFLIEIAKEEGKGIYIYKKGEEFKTDDFKKHIEEGYVGEVIYNGGGNFLVLYKSEDVFKEINKKLTFRILKEYNGMKVLATCIKVNIEGSYLNDRNKLYAKHRINENQELVTRPINTLPIVQVDPNTSMPLTCRNKTVSGSSEERNKEKVSRESNAKYKKYEEFIKNNDSDDVKQLDDMVEKGESSQLAVIYIDGNNMSNQIQGLIENNDTYEVAIKKLRDFSKKIDEEYVEKPVKEIKKELDKEGKTGKKRLIVAAGDEMTIICNAKHAYKVLETYFRKQDEISKNNTSCAGVAIFHSHAPFADAYAIAEECCSNAKKKLRENNIENSRAFDFHYCQGAIGTSLEDIRRSNHLEDKISTPWYVFVKDNEIKLSSDVDEKNNFIVSDVIEFLQAMNHSNVKALGKAALRGDGELNIELQRVIAHSSKEDNEYKNLENKYEKKELRKAIRDVVTMYDLWFKKGEEYEESNN